MVQLLSGRARLGPTCVDSGAGAVSLCTVETPRDPLIHCPALACQATVGELFTFLGLRLLGADGDAVIFTLRGVRRERGDAPEALSPCLAHSRCSARRSLRSTADLSPVQGGAPSMPLGHAGLSGRVGRARLSRSRCPSAGALCDLGPARPGPLAIGCGRGTEGTACSWRLGHRGPPRPGPSCRAPALLPRAAAWEGCPGCHVRAEDGIADQVAPWPRESGTTVDFRDRQDP